ncbi:LacI family DNA-binding transcriptional regulator [Leifsonia sp. 21MFCrub1.1]|uniref:LacI family DNA-binding transcriptional regulator n=1 Tax=Leifsonia sp. 21MFCrub1.1 TaxID=1798223 RepID=UPI0008928DD7|nr:LacI family DNA-binding transcriptional regulator [Leifsonia sp. 21MFCrub1.1]SEB07969.1 DNA-binding transcriptional regulator, LacI/PurR family [Leifsonia sp. 21MFCrub1.1]
MTTDSPRRGRRQGGPPTLKDVAAVAGVSYRTVSNVINGHRYISETTREKVEAAIAELDYRPQLAARQLRSGRSNLLTLSVPFVSHPYFAQLAHAVVGQAEKVGYDVVIDETRGTLERELRVAAGFKSILTDGILFSPLTIDLERFEAERGPTPLVLLGERFRSDNIDSVVVDNVSSTGEVTQTMIDAGRTRIAFLGDVVSGTIGAAPADLRLAGFTSALEAAGLTPARIVPVEQWDQVNPHGDYSREEGYERTKELIRSGAQIDGLFCANDLLAIGALRAFRENGVRVPEDVAVVGWDNTAEAAYTAPALTTVAPDMDELARLAIAAMLRRLDQPDAEPRTTRAPYAVVHRDSSGFPPTVR